MSRSTLPDETPTHFRWNVFVMACGTSWLLYLHRYTFALIKPELSREWELGKDQLGLLDSAFSVFYSGCQIPLGIAADVAGVHLVLTIMIVVWSIGLAMHAWAPTPNHLWSARAALGLGQSAVFAAQNRLTRTWFPVSTRTTVQGWLGVSFGRFGGLTANLLVGSIMLGVLQIPWRTAVYMLAALGIGHAILFATFFRNTPRSHPSVNDAEANLIEKNDTQQKEGEPRLSFRAMFRRMSPRSIGNLMTLNFQTILSTLADNIFSAWIPLFLFEEHGLDYTEMGFYAALPLLGGCIGGAFGGWLNDRLIVLTGSRRWTRSLVGLAGKGTAGILLFSAMLWYDSPRFFCVTLFFVKFFSDWSLTTTWGVVTDIGGRTSATVFAFNNSVAGIGAILGPYLYGVVAEYYGWIPVFLTAAVTYLTCATSWLFINSNIPVISETPD
jgi:ACS family glucarate transporter-like MFS transporter